MRVTVVDNYDSFTFNLVQALLVLGARVEVVRNDQRSVADVLADEPDRLLVSPGPGGPPAAGISRQLIEQAAGRIPLLGVCLGHQCLAEVFGARIVRVVPVHGKTSPVHHCARGLFAGLPDGFRAARYHSLAVDPASVPEELEVTARAPDGVIMGLRHRRLPLAGVQFHPESFMTPDGPRLLARFLEPTFAERSDDAPSAVGAGPLRQAEPAA